MSTETSFEYYSFTYYWTVNHMYECLRAGITLKSPEFSSPANQNPVTFWKLEVHKVTDPADGRARGEYMGAKLIMRSCSVANGCWVRVYICPQYLVRSPSSWSASYIGSWNSNPLRKLNPGSDPLCTSDQDRLFNFTGKYENPIRVQCTVYVYMLNSPKHKGDAVLAKLSPSVTAPEHNLGQSIEEARQKGLLTDVTLVTGRKEFKAHKIVLAAQSAFFKTRFEQRWEQSGDRVELNDVSPEILEAVLKYMYTGQVDKIDDKDLRVARDHELLAVADQYELEKLRTTCEAALTMTISDENVIDTLIRADTSNAKDLKRVCIEYIVRNPSQAKKNSAWSKLEAKSEGIEKLKMEVFEACFNSLL